MPDYPMSVTIHEQEYTFHRILKDDFFSLNILYTNRENEGYVLKLSNFRFVFGWMLRPLAAWISKREYTIYQMVADISGIPALGPRYGKRGYFHQYIEGKTLYECQNDKVLPRDFFDQLRDIVEQVHQRRIFYADLNKRGNIICSTTGKAYLIDFQICVPFKSRTGMVGEWLNRIFHCLVQEDLYHVLKHKKNFQPELMNREEQAGVQRSSLNQWYGRWVWRPYVTIKRLIYPHGSNETIWYKWKHEKDQSSRMP
ncbi:MAG: hypothetical protein VST67_02420 [Nitrospirota bacterium]|nr:hypothetical protein [Nitrospirota bacterium]